MEVPEELRRTMRLAVDEHMRLRGSGIAAILSDTDTLIVRRPTGSQRTIRWVIFEELPLPPADGASGGASGGATILPQAVVLEAAQELASVDTTDPGAYTYDRFTVRQVRYSEGSQRQEQILHHVRQESSFESIRNDTIWTCLGAGLAFVGAVAGTTAAVASGGTATVLAVLAWVNFAGGAVQCGGNLARVRAYRESPEAEQALSQNRDFQSTMALAANVELASAIIMLRPTLTTARTAVGAGYLRSLRPRARINAAAGVRQDVFLSQLDLPQPTADDVLRGTATGADRQLGSAIGAQQQQIWRANAFTNTHVAVGLAGASSAGITLAANGESFASAGSAPSASEQDNQDYVTALARAGSCITLEADGHALAGWVFEVRSVPSRPRPTEPMNRPIPEEVLSRRERQWQQLNSETQEEIPEPECSSECHPDCGDEFDDGCACRSDPMCGPEPETEEEFVGPLPEQAGIP